VTERTTETVVLTVPATAEQLALLRALIGYYAGREQFTLDQIDDLKMAVDEAGVQLLRHVSGDSVRLEITRVPAGIAVRVSADVDAGASLIDESTFSWAILDALTDELDVERSGGRAAVVLVKHQLEAIADPRPEEDLPARGQVQG
jgi:serine/threonine-protein kinase RsbW